MKGYVRADGRKGIRNTVVVAYLVECAHHVAREIAAPFDDVHVIGFPGCYENAYARDMMRRLCSHPNVGAALLVSLGCEGFDRVGVARTVGESGRPVCRLYYSDLPSMKMKARLVEWGSTLEVELWKSGKGFSLCLTYEHAYELDEHLREALVPALSRYEEDDYLDQYYELFYPLEHYVRIQGRT